MRGSVRPVSRSMRYWIVLDLSDQVFCSEQVLWNKNLTGGVENDRSVIGAFSSLEHSDSQLVLQDIRTGRYVPYPQKYGVHPHTQGTWITTVANKIRSNTSVRIRTPIEQSLESGAAPPERRSKINRRHPIDRNPRFKSRDQELRDHRFAPRTAFTSYYSPVLTPARRRQWAPLRIQ